jgi:hypothetical protein
MTSGSPSSDPTAGFLNAEAKEYVAPATPAAAIAATVIGRGGARASRGSSTSGAAAG